MGTFEDPSRAVDPTLQTYILGKLTRLPRGAVVSASAMAADIRSALPVYPLTDEQMARLVSETAMLLGLIPVIDPAWKGVEVSEDQVSFGYGYPAHRPDPSAVYVFSPGPPRTLPIRGNRQIRLTK